MTSLFKRVWKLKFIPDMNTPTENIIEIPEQIHMTFKMSDVAINRPLYCDIRLYNYGFNAVDEYIKRGQYIGGVELYAGYEEQHGLLFKGRVFAVRKGRINNNTTYLDIRASVAMQEINYIQDFVTNARGMTYEAVINNVCASIDLKTVQGDSLSKAELDTYQNTKLIRAYSTVNNAQKTFLSVFGSCGIAVGFSPQSQLVMTTTDIIPEYAIDYAVVLNSKTGLIGRATQTELGIQFKSLLNPLIRTQGYVKLDKASIDTFYYPTEYAKQNVFIPDYEADGIYRIISCNHTGDTRGQEWYVDCICINQEHYRANKGPILSGAYFNRG